MSFNGALIFKRNLEKLMASDAFKKADDAERLQLGGMLLRSKYGVYALSAPKPLQPEPDEK